VVMVYFNIPYISIETRFLKTYFNNILPQICYLLYKISLSPQFSSCGYWNSIYCFYNAQCNLYAHSKIWGFHGSDYDDYHLPEDDNHYMLIVWQVGEQNTMWYHGGKQKKTSVNITSFGFQNLNVMVS
jgi:hypothetical protein